MKKMLFLFTLLSFVFIGSMTTASACPGMDGKPCAKCAEKMKMKPCEKCLEAKAKKEPCAKCAESERKFQEAKTGSHLKSNIGSLQMKSRGKVDTGFND